MTYMRNPRANPQKGDVLEHDVSGERRSVLERSASDAVRYSDRNGTVGTCTSAEWQEWARRTSILGLGNLELA